MPSQTQRRMKHEWRKKEKQVYLPKNKPEKIHIPSFKFITITGAGNPNKPEFGEYIAVLYTLAYAIKMNLKKSTAPPKGYVDYTVYPLEGIWDLNEEAKKNFDGKINKDDFVFELMLRQPSFVSNKYFEEMLELSMKKKTHPLLKELKFKEIEDGLSVQMMHLGSYDNEPASFNLMENFAKQNQLTRVSKVHREIYLSDFRKVPTEKLKTVLRFKVSE